MPAILLKLIALPRWVKLAGAGILAAIAFLWWLDGVKDRAVEEAQAKQAAAVAAQREANDQRAARQAAADTVTNAQADQRNADAIARAQTSDPDGVKRQAGPATRAVLEGLR